MVYLRNRFKKEEDGYVCLEHVVGCSAEKPRTEFGVGDFYPVEQIADEWDAYFEKGRENQGPEPMLMIQFRDGTSQRYGLLKVSSPTDHDDVSPEWLRYVGRLTHQLAEYMRKQNPHAKLVGAATLLYTDDKDILGMLRRYVAEEVVKYQVAEPSEV